MTMTLIPGSMATKGPQPWSKILPWEVLAIIIAWTSVDIHSLHTFSLASRDIHTECCQYLWSSLKLPLWRKTSRSWPVDLTLIRDQVQEEFLRKVDCITQSAFNRASYVKNLDILTGSEPLVTPIMFGALRDTLPFFVNLTTLTIFHDLLRVTHLPYRLSHPLDTPVRTNVHQFQFLDILNTATFAPRLVRFHARDLNLWELDGFFLNHPLIQHFRYVGSFPRPQIPLPTLTSLDTDETCLQHLIDSSPVEQVQLSPSAPILFIPDALAALTISLVPIRRLDISLISDEPFILFLSSLPHLLHLTLRAAISDGNELGPVQVEWFKALAAHNSIVAFDVKHDSLDIPLWRTHFLRECAPCCVSLLEFTLTSLPFAGALDGPSGRVRRASRDVFEWKKWDAEEDSVAYRMLPKV